MEVEKTRIFVPDESGCEADMAEGSVEEDSGEMLGPSGAPPMPMHTPSVATNLSIKDEVSLEVI